MICNKKNFPPFKQIFTKYNPYEPTHKKWKFSVKLECQKHTVKINTVKLQDIRIYNK